MSKTKEETAVKPVLQYLTDQNRPYSVTDIFNNLHKEHGKTAVMRALDQLVSEQKIKEKTYGKQKVYFLNQDHFPEANDEDLKSMDTEINNLTKKLNGVQQEIKTKENHSVILESSLTTEEARNHLSRLKKEIPILEAKLKQLESKKCTINPEELKILQANKAKYLKERQKRKRIASDMIDAILESYQHGKEQLLDEIGVETD